MCLTRLTRTDLTLLKGTFLRYALSLIHSHILHFNKYWLKNLKFHFESRIHMYVYSINLTTDELDKSSDRILGPEVDIALHKVSKMLN